MINQNFKFSNIQWSKVGDLIIPLSMEQFSNPGNNLRTIQKSLSLSDITGSKMTIDEIIQNLGRLPLLFWINFVSSISTFLAIKGQNNFELQRSLALDYSTGKYQEIIINLSREALDNLNGAELGGRNLKVSEARPREDKGGRSNFRRQRGGGYRENW